MKQQEGRWIKIHTKIMEKAFYKTDSEAVHLWIHLLLCANWNEKEEMLGGKPYMCQPGQFTTGRKQLSNDTGIDESKIERLLKKFEEIEQQIEQRKTNTNRLITIRCWDEIVKTNNKTNNNRTTSEQRVNTLVEDLEYKEDKEYILSDFDVFWNLYDKKVGKKEKLQKKWESLKPEDKTKILEHLPKYKISQPNPKYRKNPETYLNNESWNDEIIGIATDSLTKAQYQGKSISELVKMVK